jgi:cell wall-associated NlpC family hydrolase
MTKTTRFTKTLVGISLSLSMIFSGTMFLTSNTAHAASTTQSNWESKADSIIAQAQSLIGVVQYGYGKNDPKTMMFDCSSFTKYLYAKQGTNLRWGARSQYKENMPIDRSELRKGDLVFFSTTKTSKYSDKVQRIGHVGIYMGNGKVIHNVSPKSDVTISDMTSGWWNTHYVAAARVLN